MRLLLLIPVAVPVVLVGAITSVLSLRAGRDAVESLAVELTQEIAISVEEHVRDFAGTPALFLNNNVGAFEADILDLNDFSRLQPYFWRQVQWRPAVTTLYYGSQQGDFLLVQTEPEPVVHLRQTATSPQRQIYALTASGETGSLLRTDTYDPRTRPWYQTAVRAGQPAWSPIYIYAANPVLGITFSRPIYADAARQDLVGVIGVDLTLSQLSQFLQQVRIGKAGHTFIIERSGDLVATSWEETSFLATPGGQERLNATNSVNPLIRESTAALAQHLGGFETLEERKFLHRTLLGERYFLLISPLRNQEGLDWLQIVVIPEAAYMTAIYREVWQTALLCLVALGLALGLGAWLIRWVMGPLWRLSLATRQIANGTWQHTLPPSPIRELDEVSGSFNQMSAQLHTTFERLQTLNTTLDQQVEDRTAALSATYQYESTLRRIQEKTRDSLDDQHILQSSLQELRDTLHLHTCVVRLYGSDPSALNGNQIIAPGAIPTPVDVNLAAEPEVNQQALRGWCFQYSSLPTTDSPAWIHGLCPIVDELGCLGDVHLVRPVDQAFAPRDMDLVKQVTTQFAIAIRQARLFQTVQQQVVALARATRLKDEFLANMSHELRTPLNAILGLSEGLQEEVFGPLTTPQKNALQTIDHSGTHLLELINDVLDVAKMEAGHVELDCHPTSVVSLCQDSLALIMPQAHQKKIQVQTQWPGDPSPVVVDERRMRQALVNLLSNAVKFTPEGGTVSLEVSRLSPPSSLCGPPMLRFTVHDTGIGIAPEHLSKLFQPFVQIESALNRHYTGTGLGLALVKKIVELHRGRVGVSSEVGVGSCFTMDLPCDEHLGSPVPPDHPSDPVTLPMGSEAASPLILLAEDNESNVKTMASYLEAKGYRVKVADNGATAIELARAIHPDLILMDIQMPGMDGLEAIGHLRRDPQMQSVPIIALTALAMSGDRERCLAAGADDYLSKPVRLRDLVQRIQQFLTTDRHPPDQGSHA